MKKLVRICSVLPIERFILRLDFTDGTQRDVDLEPFMQGPIFAPIRDDPETFRGVHVDQEAGTIVWRNGADIDPDVLYRGLKPAWMEPDKQAVQ